MPLVAEMADHGIGRTDVDVRPHLIRRHATGRREAERHLSLSEAANILDVSLDTMARSATRLGIEVGPVPEGVQRMLRAADIHRLAEVRHEDAFTGKDAAKMLCVSFRTLLIMVKDGSVVQIPVADRIKASLSFRRAEVFALIELFERSAADAPVVAAPGPEHRVLGRGGKDGFGIRRVSLAVLSGQLKPVAVWQSGRGLERFLFPRTFRT